jgi:DNA-binding transcriptional MerR regulator
LYRRKDVELVLEIKRLLYDKRYTIEGARKYLDARSREAIALYGAQSPAIVWLSLPIPVIARPIFQTKPAPGPHFESVRQVRQSCRVRI